MSSRSACSVCRAWAASLRSQFSDQLLAGAVVRVAEGAAPSASCSCQSLACSCSDRASICATSVPASWAMRSGSAPGAGDSCRSRRSAVMRALRHSPWSRRSASDSAPLPPCHDRPLVTDCGSSAWARRRATAGSCAWMSVRQRAQSPERHRPAAASSGSRRSSSARSGPPQSGGALSPSVSRWRPRRLRQSSSMSLRRAGAGPRRVSA